MNKPINIQSFICEISKCPDIQRLKAENEILKQLIEDVQDLCNIQSANTLDRIKAKIDEVLNG